jgi:hypothetical protein
VSESVVSQSANRHTVLWIGLLIVACWLLHPILTPAHVEGFSASIVSLALHLNAGHLADYDRLQPVNLEYFTLSRLGTVTWLSLLTGRLALSGEWAMRVTMWLGFAALTTSSFILARRWTNAPSTVVVIALLLIPGVAESSFFYTDTLFAAALGATALAVLSISPTLVATMIGGLLFGTAVVARLDAVLLAPAVALVGYEQHGLGRAFWLRAVVFTIGAVVPVILIPAALDATIFDIIGITRYAIVLWGDGFRPVQHAREVSLFVGIPAGILVALGSLGIARRSDYRQLLLLVGVPLLFNLVALGKIWQSRQLLPLTPFLTALVVLGWQHTTSTSRVRDRRSALEWTVILICALSWIAPVLVVVNSDGPRAPYGRLWTPPLWRRWQSAASSNQAEIRSLVNDPRADSSAIITDTWDADRYLHLALQETGYHQVSSHVVSEACEKTAETFAKDGRRILHVRLHQAFLPNSGELAAARIETWAQPCVRSWRPSRLIWLAPIGQLQWPLADRLAVDLPEARARALREQGESNYSPQIAVDLPPYSLELLRSAYLGAAGQVASVGPRPRWSSDLLQDAQRRMAPRVWKRPRRIP